MTCGSSWTRTSSFPGCSSRARRSRSSRLGAADGFSCASVPKSSSSTRPSCDDFRDEFTGADALDILALIVANAVVVDAPPLQKPVSADPDDDKFIACAAAAGAHFIVSGDRDLLDVEAYGRARIVRPRVFVDEYVQGPR